MESIEIARLQIVGGRQRLQAGDMAAQFRIDSRQQGESSLPRASLERFTFTIRYPQGSRDSEDRYRKQDRKREYK